jgi:TusA-related sulfurtransferase/molybdopterin converting factor small subunit
MAQVMIPTPLRTYTRGQKMVTVSGATVDDALSALTATYPDLKRHLFNEEGKLRNFVNIYLGEEDVRYLQQGATTIRETDSLSIVPSIAGGAVEVLKADKVLDCRGLLCPLPVVKIAEGIRTVEVGQTLELLTTDRGSKADITAWGKQTGHEVLDVREENSVFHFFVRRAK